jgi:hypothetical protein
MEDLDLSAVEPGFRPRLKVFLSADIIGSTAYKQPLDILRDDPRTHGQWAGIIQGFYKTIKEDFAEHWQQASNRLLLKHQDTAREYLLGPPPRFWKTIGDEVVFWKELTSSAQIWLTLACWNKTVASIRTYFEKVADQPGTQLDVKSAAWMAGFPIRNKAIVDVSSSRAPIRMISGALTAYYDGNDTVDVDFIGPGIDVGFRITSHASARKLAISLDVAYALAMTHTEMAKLAEDYGLLATDYFPEGTGSTSPHFYDRLKVHYSGSEPLKGVLGGIRYPKFWISILRHKSLEAHRVALYTRDHSQHGQDVDWTKLQHFCDKFYEDRRKFVSRPFIVGDKHLGDVPPRFKDFILAANLRSLTPVDDLAASAI